MSESARSTQPTHVPTMASVPDRGRLLGPAGGAVAVAAQGHRRGAAGTGSRELRGGRAEGGHTAPLGQHGRVRDVEEEREEQAQPTADEEVQRHLCHGPAPLLRGRRPRLRRSPHHRSGTGR